MPSACLSSKANAMHVLITNQCMSSSQPHASLLCTVSGRSVGCWPAAGLTCLEQCWGHGATTKLHGWDAKVKVKGSSAEKSWAVVSQVKTLLLRQLSRAAAS